MDMQKMQKNRDAWFQGRKNWAPLDDSLQAEKLIVVVPHPDDEIFACGGLLQRWSSRVREVVFVHVTDGDAASAFRNPAEQSALAMKRMEGDRVARARLNMQGFVRFKECHLPDANVALFCEKFVEVLAMEADKDSIVLAPYLKDGNVDHEAIGRCVQNLQKEYGFTLLFYPVWLWFQSEPEPASDFRLLQLSDEELQRKREAIDCFHKEMGAADPLLPPAFLQHYKSSPYEVYMLAPNA